MIFYFSGTGNSRYAALTLGDKLGEEVSPIAFSECASISPKGNTLGIVCPVYSWGVPPIVLRFIENLNDEMAKWAFRMPVWIVLVCGDETGYAPRMMKAALKRRGINLAGGWSLQMPNNYVLLPGFDVDSKAVEQEKLSKAPDAINAIAEKIINSEWEENYVIGSMPWIKSRIIYPLFTKWGIDPKLWRATDACVGCGLCAKNCPTRNITMTSEKSVLSINAVKLGNSGNSVKLEKFENTGNSGDHPIWGSNCVSCLSCYHICPRNAVQYSSITRKKGQYYFTPLPPKP